MGLNNACQAIVPLYEDEKSTIILNDGVQGGPPRLIINESGLYTLILRSRKPVTQEFRKWVTSEVLPAIRRTGGYIPITKDIIISDTLIGYALHNTGWCIEHYKAKN